MLGEPVDHLGGAQVAKDIAQNANGLSDLTITEPRSRREMVNSKNGLATSTSNRL
jgi:hypothetical protein